MPQFRTCDFDVERFGEIFLYLFSFKTAKLTGPDLCYKDHENKNFSFSEIYPIRTDLWLRYRGGLGNLSFFIMSEKLTGLDQCLYDHKNKNLDRKLRIAKI